MTEAKIRSVIGVGLIFSQIAVIILAVVIHIMGGLRFDELTTAIGLILPMFAVHTAAIAKYFTAHRSEVSQQSPKVTGAFVVLACGIPTAFVFYLACVLIIRGFGEAFMAPEQLKWALSIGETCFGVYLGVFIGTLFDEKVPINN